MNLKLFCEFWNWIFRQKWRFWNSVFLYQVFTSESLLFVQKICEFFPFKKFKILCQIGFSKNEFNYLVIFEIEFSNKKWRFWNSVFLYLRYSRPIKLVLRSSRRNLIKSYLVASKLFWLQKMSQKWLRKIKWKTTLKTLQKRALKDSFNVNWKNEFSK